VGLGIRGWGDPSQAQAAHQTQRHFTEPRRTSGGAFGGPQPRDPRNPTATAIVYRELRECSAVRNAPRRPHVQRVLVLGPTEVTADHVFTCEQTTRRLPSRGEMVTARLRRVLQASPHAGDREIPLPDFPLNGDCRRCGSHPRSGAVLPPFQGAASVKLSKSPRVAVSALA